MDKRKLLVISNNYPCESNIYANAFIHARTIHYLNDFEVQIVVFNINKVNTEYVYENIHVRVISDKKVLHDYINWFSPNVIAIHFVEHWMLNAFMRQVSCPVYIWVHGVEALAWYRRLFNFRISQIKEFLSYVVRNTIQLIGLRKIIAFSNNSGKVRFIFVSKWMKHITESDTHSHIQNYSIIPNPIDNSLFIFQKKESELRKHILLIRPFESRKYANDIAIDAILELSKRPCFSEIEFTIYGKGILFDSLTSKVSHLKNVTIINSFVEHSHMPDVFKSYGVLLCPTRQDAQGVSMCEAMSSGLVVISSNNTAIPEFVNDGKTGILTNNAKEIADKIEYLYNNPDVFQQISQSASHSIGKICGHEKVIAQEILLLNS